jgi:YfiH family protein
MPVEASDVSRGVFIEGRGGTWRLERWAGPSVVAGVTTRHAGLAGLLRLLPSGARMAAAEQVHGSSVAAIGPAAAEMPPVPGCDALVTGTAGLALLIRTADCLPLFIADPGRRVVGLAHAGWRGLAAGLPARLIAAFRNLYQSRPEDLWAAIGPAIRTCCYEVGPEFAGWFGPFVQGYRGRRTCDLIGVARDQLRRCGVRPGRTVDCGQCTACEGTRWFSLRREGPATDRMVSFILIRP